MKNDFFITIVGDPRQKTFVTHFSKKYKKYEDDKEGFIKNECLSSQVAYRLTDKTNFKKWNARHNKYCNCVEMVDIGAYNSCGHFCKYCYANFDEDKIKENRAKHDVNSTCLIGTIPQDAKINVRKN